MQGKKQVSETVGGPLETDGEHMLPNMSHIWLHPSGPMLIKISASPTHVGLAVGPPVLSWHTWHCMSDCRKPSLQLSTASWAASQRRLSWLTRSWSSLESALSVCRNSLLLTLTETSKALWVLKAFTISYGREKRLGEVLSKQG